MPGRHRRGFCGRRDRRARVECRRSNAGRHGSPDHGTAAPAGSNAMTARTDVLLSRLQHVRKSGPSSWRADCPNGHQHARGSLAITEAEQGHLMLHCFACSDTPAVLAAIGLELADLYPERIRDPSPEGRRRAREAFKQSAWAAALRVLEREATVCIVAAGMLRAHLALTPADDSRLAIAMERIRDARAVLA